MSIETAKSLFPQYAHVVDTLVKPGSLWTREESKSIEILISSGGRESLRLVQEEARKND